ncbi:hypothetical protein BVRB_4g081740 [Beta vulgaris subsp. vulgaris]|nr:hypothetical protein BVRB_4g081740 [Beta vulgaris subsp. vulgaris]
MSTCGSPLRSESTIVQATDNLGRCLRTKISSIKRKGYVTHTVVQRSSPSLSSSPSPPPSSTLYPITHYVSCDIFSVPHRNFVAAITIGVGPRSFKEAFTDPGWRAAMQSEMEALEKNGTWTLESLPPGKQALGSQWIYKIKYNSDASIERLKARLVVFGNR